MTDASGRSRMTNGTWQMQMADHNWQLATHFPRFGGSGKRDQGVEAAAIVPELALGS